MSARKTSVLSNIYFEEEEINWRHGLSQASETSTGSGGMQDSGAKNEAAHQ